MNTLKSRRIRHFLRLTYPVAVVALPRGFRAVYPDLPGCKVLHALIDEVYGLAEAARRAWITERVLTDEAIPLPNSHLARAACDRQGEQT